MLLIWLGQANLLVQTGEVTITLEPTGEERTLTPIDPTTTLVASWGIPGRLITA